MLNKLLALVIIGVFVCSTAAQTAAPKPDENAAKLEKEAVEFLRETSAEVGRLRTAENRISFSAELAGLMWFHDDKEARAMYGNVVSDFKQLLAQLDAQMNMPVVDDDDMNSGGFLFGGYGKSKAERKLRIAMAVRQQIAMSLAEHAPDLAYNFYYDSINLITNAAFRKEIEQTDKSFESRLLTQIAESDAAKAVDYGKESVKRGLNMNHIELLKKVYAKDVDKGIELGAAILSRLKSETKSLENIYFYSRLLSFGSTNFEASKKPGGKKAIYSQTDLRDIAEQVAQLALSDSEESNLYTVMESLDEIEKYAPSRAVQIRAKFKSSHGSGNVKEMRLDRITAIASNGANTAANAAPNTAKYEAEQRAREEREKREKKMIEDVMSLGKKELPKEERAKIIAESRKIISQTPGKDKKIVALSLLAAQVAKAGDKDLADEIMRDAERLVNPEPKNYQDFMLSWMLASGYAEANPDKAFPILENTFLRANETISAFIKVAEFVDVNAEMIDEGEFQVGMFGGEMIRGMTRELGMAAGPLKTLARADFTKTRNLTNVFDRTETRVLAKMLILRAVLDKREIKRTDEEMTERMSDDK
ncbi:MAG: hypothetical protein WBD16_01845 [Pyrinomonadaceae bacterium]